MPIASIVQKRSPDCPNIPKISTKLFAANHTLRCPNVLAKKKLSPISFISLLADIPHWEHKFTSCHVEKTGSVEQARLSHIVFTIAGIVCSVGFRQPGRLYYKVSKIRPRQLSMANIIDPKKELSSDAPASSSWYFFNWKNKAEMEGSSDVQKPKMRSTQEILTKYKFDGDAAAATAHAKEKLVERQEKLARISQESAELQSESEIFASLAQQITKSMENKRWWKP